MSQEFDPQSIAVRAVLQCAIAHTGFSTQALRRDAVERLVRTEIAEGRTVDELCRLAMAADPRLLRLIKDAVLVGETYFFRQPEHFQFLAHRATTLVESGARTLRGWSAGCATGEEPYSLAACLLGVARNYPEVKVEVLGTDLSERHLSIAAAGSYGAWSQRESGPMLYPLFKTTVDGKRRVLDEVRRVTAFAQHNLTAPLPMAYGPFDFIFCRNVLAYFSPDAAQLACHHLVRALGPEGLLMFSPMDVDHPGPGVRRIEPTHLQLFVRDSEAQKAARQRPKPALDLVAEPVAPVPLPSYTMSQARPSRPLAQTSALGPEQAVALHLKALALVEVGEEPAAERVLHELRARAPDYLPGILELALLHTRGGKQSSAEEMMKDVLKRASALPEEDVVRGPQPLPAQFYAASARAYLDRQGRRR